MTGEAAASAAAAEAGAHLQVMPRINSRRKEPPKGNEHARGSDPSRTANCRQHLASSSGAKDVDHEDAEVKRQGRRQQEWNRRLNGRSERGLQHERRQQRGEQRRLHVENASRSTAACNDELGGGERDGEVGNGVHAVCDGRGHDGGRGGGLGAAERHRRRGSRREEAAPQEAVFADVELPRKPSSLTWRGEDFEGEECTPFPTVLRGSP